MSKFMYWLNVDIPTKRCTVHTLNCPHKPIKSKFKNIKSLGEEGRWIPFSDLYSLVKYRINRFSDFKLHYCADAREQIGENILLNELVTWICINKPQFYKNGKTRYDEDNLKRIIRFSNAPNEYLKERLEINKEALKNYHKLHHSILLAGLTGVYLLFLNNFLKSLIEKYQNFTWNICELDYIKMLGSGIWLVLFVIVIPFTAIKFRLTTKILNWSGLMRVMLDSEIEVYYLTKIMESRKE